MSRQEPGSRMRVRANVSGLVQGVGFRPFVWRSATERGLTGWVGNDAAGVVLEVEGDSAAVSSFLTDLATGPTTAHVSQVRAQQLELTGEDGFQVRKSETQGALLALAPPDTATCSDCLRELRDPTDRRFRHPFVTCTSCGPRYTVITALPYDRARTTMATFPLCARCQDEYEDPTERRFHAETVCCPDCGPVLQYFSAQGLSAGDDPIDAALALLSAGGVLAVKGIGGYHLAADARDERAVATLRARKRRPDRPFAVMVADLAGAAALCELDPLEQTLLDSRARPIVLLRKQHETVASGVAPRTAELGLMLPYTPLHELLLKSHGGPIVLTSGNSADEPIAYDDRDAVGRLGEVADGFLVHDRVIRTPVDDSVVRVVAGRVLTLRRSRGYAPAALRLPVHTERPLLACGAALKSTFCLTRGSDAFMSQHLGDLGSFATWQAYVAAIDHLSGLLGIEPEVVVHDLHPDYPSTRYAMDRRGVEHLAVQHHHAHIASCLVDNEEQGPVIGVAFDGVGLGPDGSAWGGEFLVADLRDFERVAHLSEVPLPGGDAAAREPWRMAAAHLEAAYGAVLPDGLDVVRRQGRRWDQVLSAARAGVNAPRTSSAGRLFDGVAALLGVRDVVTYEGQAAIELEQIADAGVTDSYPVQVTTGPVAQVEVAELVRAVTSDVLRGTAVPTIAARFHNTIAIIVLDVCCRLRVERGLDLVALSGGVFQNALLVQRCVLHLESAGFTVLTHTRVPPNDGGISLGQAAVAAARLAQS